MTKLLSKLEIAERYLPERLTAIKKLLKEIDPKILEKLSDVPGFDKVIADMATTWNKFKGGHFQLKYAEQLLEQGKKIKFEVNDLSDDLKRIYDIVIEGEEKATRLIVQSLELKNWKQIYSETIKKQFTKDLVKMQELGDIQWVFKKTTNNAFTPESLREGIIETLKKADVKEELNKLFDEKGIFAKKISTTFKMGIEDANDLIEAIGKSDKFNEIFKIAE